MLNVLSIEQHFKRFIHVYSILSLTFLVENCFLKMLNMFIKNLTYPLHVNVFSIEQRLNFPYKSQTKKTSEFVTKQV